MERHQNAEKRSGTGKCQGLASVEVSLEEKGLCKKEVNKVALSHEPV